MSALLAFAEHLHRCQQAPALRLTGAHYRQLGAQLVISQQPAIRDVVVAMANIT